MNRWTMLFAALIVTIFVALGCSGGGEIPVSPSTDLDLTAAESASQEQSQTHLWGFYDIYLDIENQEVEVVPNRNGMFAANVVTFLNGNPAYLQFDINETPMGLDFIDVDINVGISHPFPGMSEYDGYDVRGIFIGDGSHDMITCLFLCCNSNVAMPGVDQFMKDYNLPEDPQLCGNPDGYIRWWNPTEFLAPGVLGYTQGVYATQDYSGSATINPFKYFADGLDECDDTWDFLTSGVSNGVFSAGTTNSRNYYLRFPNSKEIKYNYAVVANWIDETTHPANAPEAVSCKVEFTEDAYYVDETTWGGNLIADISIFDWDSEVAPSGIMEDYTLAIVSWDLFQDAPPTEDYQYVFTLVDMTPVASGANYYTYHVEVPVSNLEALEGNEMFVKAVCGNAAGDVFIDYTNDFGVPNEAGEMPLTAYFRYDVPILSENPFDPNIYTYWAPDDGAGDLAPISSGLCSWAYVASFLAWDESGNPYGYPNSCCTILATPPLSIPDVPGYDLHLEITHWGCSEGAVAYYYAYDGGAVAYTTNGGVNYTVNGPYPGSTWLTYSSGNNFNSQDNWYGLDYTWDVAGCTWFDVGDGWTTYGWYNKFFHAQDSWYYQGWGTEGTPWVSNWICNSLIGTENVQVCFIFRTDESVTEGVGWCIRGVKLVMVPV